MKFAASRSLNLTSWVKGAAPPWGSRGSTPCWGPADSNGIFGRAAPRWGLGDPNGIFGAPSGFGAVFRGSIGDNQVAVKILSESSAQGNHKGIIYKYMANGNLGQHLFGLIVTIASGLLAYNSHPETVSLSKQSLCKRGSMAKLSRFAVTEHLTEMHATHV
ncbi:hypothetical protein Tco_0545427 [Tanacetum coccineum]